jgi:DNA-binding MarR family transcriptional regulator
LFSPAKLVFDLSLARSRIVRDVDATLGAHHGVGLSDMVLLLALQNAPGKKLRRVELAEKLGITTSGVARQVEPLERIGLVAREPSPGDARLALVTLTPTGERIAGDAYPTAEETAERVLDRIWSRAEQDQLASLLERINP